jgi:hypothetical protein
VKFHDRYAIIFLKRDAMMIIKWTSLLPLVTICALELLSLSKWELFLDDATTHFAARQPGRDKDSHGGIQWEIGVTDYRVMELEQWNFFVVLVDG